MNTDDPYFSVIMPTYNRAHLLQPAIDSVSGQTCADWELVIVDDGSTDNTADLVRANMEKDGRIRYIYQENAERSAARNNGIDHARGRYICFLDSDDRYKPDCLEVLYRRIQAEDEPIALFVFNASMAGPDGQINSTTSFLGDISNRSTFVFRNPIATPRACVHHNLLQLEQFNESLRIGEDKELWLRLVQHAPVIALENALVVQIDHEDRSISEGHYKASLDGLKANQLIQYENEDFKYKIPKALIRSELSNSMQKVALHYMWTGRRLMAIVYLLRALLTSPGHQKSKLRINAFFKLMLGTNSIDVAKMCR